MTWSFIAVLLVLFVMGLNLVRKPAAQAEVQVVAVAASAEAYIPGNDES